MGKIPTVTDGLLLLEDVGRTIELNSDEWGEWLNQNSSFRYESKSQPGFTARVEKSNYWYAYRKVAGKLHKRYIGKPEELTINRLEEIATLLNEPQQRREKKVTQQVTQDLYVTSYATNDDVAQLWKAVGELRQEVAALGKLKAR